MTAQIPGQNKVSPKRVLYFGGNQLDSACQKILKKKDKKYWKRTKSDKIKYKVKFFCRFAFQNSNLGESKENLAGMFVPASQYRTL